MFKKIIVCSDGSDTALFATRAGAAIAERFDSTVQLLDVLNPMYMDTEGLGVWSLMTDQDSICDTAAIQHQAIQALSVPVFKAANVPFTAIQELGHPVGTITEYAERSQPDLIVIGSRGLNELKSFVMGSVSSGVLHYAPCPVLVTRGEGLPPGAGWFQNILLASDGSPAAHQAALAALALAQKFGSALTVVNVREKPKLLVEVLPKPVVSCTLPKVQHTSARRCWKTSLLSRGRRGLSVRCVRKKGMPPSRFCA